MNKKYNLIVTVGLTWLAFLLITIIFKIKTFIILLPIITVLLIAGILLWTLYVVFAKDEDENLDKKVKKDIDKSE